MARNWRDIRKQAVDTGQIDPQRVAQHFEQYRAEQLAYRLSELRKAHGLRQEDIAESMRVTQRRVSAVENGELSRTELGTVEAYIRALGGRVKVIAEFPDGELVTLD
ncbi:helix-turn-helix domain-containing protein [Actinocatenispora comari]|jgi:predicted XRE-type DNA-binding protein|uniref:Transcriptional regulator n=1 Tax=Actinocatenispora comari TaxID=2807577 RepID=A0A8J4AF78_9ACTN|nr:helix-turn-helix domain-containing protein [Actinocatenispora comari]GIL28037.1 transcriptional regulator [Actinocatenispora comari]